MNICSWLNCRIYTKNTSNKQTNPEVKERRQKQGEKSCNKTYISKNLKNMYI